MPLTTPAQGGPYQFVILCDANGVPNTQITNNSISILVFRSAATLLNLASAARATYSSGPIAVSPWTELAVDFNVTALTGGAAPTVTFKVSRIGADGILYQLEQATAISAAGVISYNIGAGLDSKSFGSNIQIDMVVTGAPTSITFSGSVIGK